MYINWLILRIEQQMEKLLNGSRSAQGFKS
jgi:hypothetical protein